MKSRKRLPFDEQMRRRDYLDSKNIKQLYPRLLRNAKLVMIRYGLISSQAPTYSDPEDYVNDTIAKYLSGERNFNEKEVPFVAFMHNSIRSLVGNHLKSNGRIRLHETGLLLENQEDKLLTTNTRETEFINDLMAYLAHFGSPEMVNLARVILVEDIYSNHAIAAYLNMTELQVKRNKIQLMELITRAFPDIRE